MRTGQIPPHAMGLVGAAGWGNAFWSQPGPCSYEVFMPCAAATELNPAAMGEVLLLRTLTLPARQPVFTSCLLLVHLCPAESDQQPHRPLASKSVNFLAAYHSLSKDAAATAVAADNQPLAQPAPKRGSSRVWRMRSSRSQPWLELPAAAEAAAVAACGSDSAKAPVGWEAIQKQPSSGSVAAPPAGFAPAKSGPSRPAAIVQLAEQTQQQKGLEQQQDETEQGKPAAKTAKR